MNLNSKVITSIFAAVIFGLAVLNLLAPKRDFSENENRMLAQMPKLSAETILNGKFPSGFDEYITDQFVARDFWISAKTMSEIALQKRSSNGVYFAKNGTLIEMFDSVDISRFERNIGFLRDFSDRMQSGLNIKTDIMLVPSTSMILSNQLPPFAPEVDQRAMLDYAAENLPGFVDTSAALTAKNSEYIFYGTDHHWTSLGAFYAYNYWRTQNGLAEKDITGYNTTVLSDDFYGTVYSKANTYTIPPDTIHAIYPKDAGKIQVDYNNENPPADSIYEYSFLDVKDKYSVFLNANQPIINIKTENENGRKLLVIKDSYANSFAQFLLSDYSEIVIIDPRYYKTSVYDYAKENAVTDVLVLYSIKGFSADSNIYFLTT